MNKTAFPLAAHGRELAAGNGLEELQENVLTGLRHELVTRQPKNPKAHQLWDTIDALVVISAAIEATRNGATLADVTAEGVAEAVATLTAAGYWQ